MINQKNLYILDNRKTTIGIISNNMSGTLPFYDDIQTRDLDDYTNSLTFSVPANHTDAHLIIAGGYVLYPSADDEFQLFKIMSTTESHAEGKYSKKIYCEISAQDDLIKDVVRPTSFSSASLKDVLTSVLAGSDWEVGNVEDFGVKDYKIDDYPTKLKAVIDAVAEYGGELNFEYSMLKSSVTINSQKVSAYKQLGTVTNKLFTYGIDIEGVERTEDVSKLITAVVVVGKSDSDSTPITIANIPVSQLGDLPEGYEKPTAGDWVGSQTAVQNYSPTGKHIFGVYKDNEARSPAELFANALGVLKQYSRPQMTYKVSVALLSELAGYEVQKVAIGDTIVVQDVTLNPALYVSARIRQFNRSISDPTQSSVELGDYIPIVPSINQTVQQLQSTIRDKEETWDTAKTQAEDAIDAANRAEQSASEAGAKADEAQNTAESAQSTATTAQNTADTALDGVGNLDTRVTTVEQKVTDEAIVSTVRTSTEYTNDLGEKVSEEQASQIAQSAENVKIGFNDISDKVVIDNEGLTINDGGLTIKNNAGSNVLTADSTGNLVMSGKLTAGEDDRLELDNGVLKFYRGGVFFQSITANQYPPRYYLSNFKESPTGSLYSVDNYSKGLSFIGKIVTQWFRLAIPSQLPIGTVASFNGLIIDDYAEKQMLGVGAVIATTMAQELSASIVNWSFSGLPSSVYSVDLRLRNITQTTQPARTVDVCVILLGSN
ncbi:hypothetical protein GTH52_02945 [Clostridium tyrobutyricum]|nr:phage tail spike protein [Clostridium tyrobutyricum]ANP69744.1 hypothetical protein BA182_08670 [Clostridium tyrobutyricum]MBV4432895.1 phage tail protein [Clostridium tyrobutyricum]QNB65891.1 hypothetical protein GTH52_02945 [Clostridium tyrobutyricum]